MNSTTQLPSLADAQQIVKSDDPKALEIAQRLLAMDDDSLIELRGTAQRVLAKERAAFEAAIAEDKLVDAVAGAIMLRRIIERGAKALPHDRYAVEIEATKTIEKRIDVLRQLEGKVPEDELRKALYLTNPQPEWKADARALGTLSRKYGGEVRAIVEAGLVETYGQPRLIFKEREQIQNVTPMERAS